MQESACKDRPENASEISLNVQIVKMSHELVSAAMQKSESSQFCDAELTTAIVISVSQHAILDIAIDLFVFFVFVPRWP